MSIYKPFSAHSHRSSNNDYFGAKKIVILPLGLEVFFDTSSNLKCTINNLNQYLYKYEIANIKNPR